MSALPLLSVVTVALPTKLAVPLAIVNTTDWFATGLPKASVICACTLLVATPLADALLVTTLSAVKGDAVLGGPVTNTTIAGLPFVILLPPTVAVIPTLPATVLVKVITALPKASVVTVALPTIVAVPLAIANTTDWFATVLPKASLICACTLLVATPLASALLITTLSA